MQRSKGKRPDMAQRAAMGLASAAVQGEDLLLACTTLEEAIAAHPGSADLVTQLSECYLLAGLEEKALENAERAMSMQPTEASTLRQLVRVASAFGRLDRASDAARRLVECRPRDAGSWMLLAQTAQKSGDIPMARDALARALWLGHHAVSTLREAAALQRGVGSEKAARLLLRRAIRLHPDDPLTLREAALEGERADDLQMASWAWQRIAHLQPDGIEAHRRLAQVLGRLGRHAEALRSWEDALAVEPEDPGLHADAARAFAKIGDYEHALQGYLTSIGKNAGAPETVLEAGRVAVMLGRLDVATPLLNRAVELAPNRAAPLVALADCFLMRGQTDAARQALEKAEGCEDVGLDLFALQSIAAIESDDMAKGEAAFLRASSQAPRTLVEAVAVSRAALRLGRWDEAERSLTPAQSLVDDVHFWIERARLAVRIADASWLYRAVHANSHAPPRDPATLIAEVVEHLTSTPDSQPMEVTLKTLRLRAAIATAPMDEGTSPAFDDLSKLALSDPTGETLETLVVGYLRHADAASALQALAGRDALPEQGQWFDILAGLCQQSFGRHDLARQVLGSVRRNPALRPIAEYLTGASWLAEGHVSEAIGSLNSAVLQWPDEAVWQYRLGDCYVQQHHLDAALPHLQKAVAAAPTSESLLVALARCQWACGQLAEARSTYEKLLGLASSHPTHWTEAGELALQMGDPGFALNCFEHASEVDSAGPRVQIGWARALAALGKQREALEKAQTALRTAPDEADVVAGAAEVYTRAGKHEKALDAYSQAMRLAPSDRTIRRARSRALLAAGKTQEAVRELRHEAQITPDDDATWAVLAEACAQSGDLDSAMGAAEEANRVAPRNAGHRQLLGQLCRRAGQLDRALDELAKAEECDPHNSMIQIELGRVHEARREIGRGLESYRRAIELEPRSSEAHFCAGLVLKSLKSYSQAAQMLQRAVELNPKDPSALHQLAAVRALELVHGTMIEMAVTQ
ncbi:MAG TPA: tetratricopeptide repeat protein [Anaerolineales bacterium]|nr:tetratricopeptide repeat protein [Anaerolineales bacterium]